LPDSRSIVPASLVTPPEAADSPLIRPPDRTVAVPAALTTALLTMPPEETARKPAEPTLTPLA
jgi:hypothetical protein